MCVIKTKGLVDITKEIWKDVEFRGLNYQVSSSGLVRSLDKTIKTKTNKERKIKGRILKQRLDADGYPIVTLGKTDRRGSKRIHRLVAEAFIPNPENLATVNHIDYDRANNKVENLEWLSHRDNVQYSSDAGRYEALKQGEGNGRAKLTEEDVIKIRKLYKQGVRTYKIAERYGRGWSTIHNVVERNTWKHIA